MTESTVKDIENAEKALTNFIRRAIDYSLNDIPLVELANGNPLRALIMSAAERSLETLTSAFVNMTDHFEYRLNGRELVMKWGWEESSDGKTSRLTVTIEGIQVEMYPHTVSALRKIIAELNLDPV